MPDFGLSIEKTTLFRGFQQPFANVYYYRNLDIGPEAEVTLRDLLNFVLAREKAIHSTLVFFTRGRVWNTNSGSRETNIMRVDDTLTGTGNGASSSSMDKERAVLAQWPAGLDSRNKPVYLRKWYHTVGVPAGQPALASDVLANTAVIPQAIRDAIRTELLGLSNPLAGGFNFQLIAKSGRQSQGTPVIHRYLEHHQLGDQWR